MANIHFFGAVTILRNYHHICSPSWIKNCYVAPDCILQCLILHILHHNKSSEQHLVITTQCYYFFLAMRCASQSWRNAFKSPMNPVQMHIVISTSESVEILGSCLPGDVHTEGSVACDPQRLQMTPACFSNFPKCGGSSGLEFWKSIFPSLKDWSLLFLPPVFWHLLFSKILHRPGARPQHHLCTRSPCCHWASPAGDGKSLNKWAVDSILPLPELQNLFFPL